MIQKNLSLRFLFPSFLKKLHNNFLGNSRKIVVSYLYYKENLWYNSKLVKKLSR